MFFSYDVTVTAGTTEAAPKTQLLKLSKGVIIGLPVKFPAGCHHLVKVRLFRYESQLVPLSRDEWITGDDESVPTESWYPLTETPAQLRLIACSPNTQHDHKITVRIRMIPTWLATGILFLGKMVELLSKMLRIPLEEPKLAELM